MTDAIVIGAGPNGLVAANLLADAGWSVQVFEAQPQAGGAVKSAELIEPGFVNDVFSAFYPLTAASPVFAALELERWGLRWRHGPLVLAHPAADRTCPALSRDLDETAAILDAHTPGDGDGWRALYRWYERAGDPLLQAMATPFPPVVAGARLAATLGGDLPRFARLALQPVRRLGAEWFRGEPAARLLAGNALHADLLPESAFGGFYGWFLTALGQTVGYPFPEGGAQRLTDALVARAESRGVRMTCGVRVERVIVRRGQAVGVRLAGGDEAAARRAVLADVHVLPLYRELLSADDVPASVHADLDRFELDTSTFKVDWTLDGPVPWSAPDARRAPVVHVADSLDELSASGSALARGEVPEQPFLLVGQYSMGDPTRAPEGRETCWAYTHLPQSVRVTPALRDDLVDRIEGRIEALAPGFRALIRGRHVLTPADLEARDENLVGGSLNGGTAQLHQQVVFRPVPGLGRPETPVRGLYLASFSAHPGGAVSGAPGANAARAALRKERAKRTAVALGAGAAAVALARRRVRT